MTPATFTVALAATRLDPAGRSAQAARAVLVDGVSRRQAAIMFGIDHAAVSRAVARLQPQTPCPHCHGTGRLGVTVDADTPG